MKMLTDNTKPYQTNKILVIVDCTNINLVRAEALYLFLQLGLVIERLVADVHIISQSEREFAVTEVVFLY